MNSHAVTSSNVPNPREGARDYLFEMIEQLSKMARRTGEVEVAILLKAILDAARVAERSRSA